jgi:hypothetical protein
LHRKHSQYQQTKQQAKINRASKKKLKNTKHPSNTAKYAAQIKYRVALIVMRTTSSAA